MNQQSELPEAFAKLGLEVRFLKAAAKAGFVEPSPVQEHLIPIALTGKDILGQARTGTGKTAAFAFPILQQIDPAGRLQALCLVPTRELAVQVAAETKRLAMFADVHVVAVYGGQRIATQLHALGRRPHFVVGTPGRVMDMMGRGVLDIAHVRFAVLDEVDRMLDIGFRDDIKTILGDIKGPHQTIFVSATIDDDIKRLAQRYMTDPVDVNVSRDRLFVEEVDQSYVTVEAYDKFHMLRMILKQEDPPVTIVFCRTKASTRKVAKKLYDAGINAKEIHGDLMQAKRDRVMEGFRKHRIKVLVATDLAARGIDVSNISHIINYDIPPDPHVYVHRIGRTARMGARGTAITFVTSEEGKQLTEVEKLINTQIHKREVPGFVPRPPPERSQHVEEKKVEPVSRFQATVHGSDEKDPAKMPRKTLGSRFRPARRRRL